LCREQQTDQELDQELRSFLEMAAEVMMKQGMSHEEALRAVRLERGNLEVTKEVVWPGRWESAVATLWQDLRFASRMPRKTPAITGVALLSLGLGLGLGIGANTAISNWPITETCAASRVEAQGLPLSRPGEVDQNNLSTQQLTL